jgi:hypothetical protein
MEKQRSVVVTDPLGRTKRRLNFGVMHQIEDAESVLRRRDEAVERLRAARADVLRELADVSPELAFAGQVWSPLTLMWHLASGDLHMEPARAIVEDGVSELADRDESGELEQAIAHVVRNIDEAIAYSSRLGAEELTAHARRMNRDYYVIGFIETTVEHLLDHIDHIRQIKKRLA